MTLLLEYLTEGSRIFLSSNKMRFSSQKYPGNAEEICRQVVADCWNGKFFCVSTGNFAQFWTRDFGWCVGALLELEYEKEVQATLKYALNKFKQHGKVTTTITPAGKPFDFPNYSVDALPWLIHAIRKSGFVYYTYRDFLNKEIEKYFEKVINPSTGLVKPEVHFSSIKDFAKRKSGCYDNTVVGMLASHLQGMEGLVNPFASFDYPQLLKRHFWTGNYFYDDLSKKEYVAGDANIFPFVLGIVKDKKMLEKSVQAIRDAGLDEPFPLKYTVLREQGKFIWQEMAMWNYEGNTIWTHMGPLYIQLVGSVDKTYATELKKRYGHWIEHFGNYLEVFEATGKPYTSPFYVCDRGMLWAANYLMLK